LGRAPNKAPASLFGPTKRVVGGRPMTSYLQTQRGQFSQSAFYRLELSIVRRS